MTLRWRGRRGAAARTQPSAAGEPERSVRRSCGWGHGHAPEVHAARAAAHWRPAVHVVEPGAEETGAGRLAGVLPMEGLEDSRRFIEAGVRRWKAFVESTQLDLDPFGLFGGRRPARGIPRLLAQDGEARCSTPATCGWAARRERSRWIWRSGLPMRARRRSNSACTKAHAATGRRESAPAASPSRSAAATVCTSPAGHRRGGLLVCRARQGDDRRLLDRRPRSPDQPRSAHGHLIRPNHPRPRPSRGPLQENTARSF